MTERTTSAIVLAVLALTLFATVIIGITLSPWAAAAIPGALLGIAAVVRAIRGTRAPEEVHENDG